MFNLPALTEEQARRVTVRANAAARADVSAAQSLVNRACAFLNMQGAFEGAEFHFFPNEFTYGEVDGEIQVTRIEALAREYTDSGDTENAASISLNPEGGASVTAQDKAGRTVILDVFGANWGDNYLFDGLICVAEEGCDLAAAAVEVKEAA